MPLPPVSRTLRISALLPLLGLSAACAASDPGPGAELEVECTGKCDGFDTIRSLVRDPSELNLDDLVELGTPFVTDQVNDLLAFSDYARLQIDETEAFDEDELGQLVTGLAARFGEQELSTEVNELRRQYLQSSSDDVYAEAAFEFELGGRLSHSFDFPVPDFFDDDGTITLGFSGETPVEARVVSAYPSATRAVLRGPLSAANELRGFVLPRSIEDIRAMKPGESVALGAHGHVALNLGAGVPLLVADPLEWASYTLVFSAGLRTRLEGDLDIQLVRLEGGEAVVDVGIERARVSRKRLAIEDRWGVQGLWDFDVEVAGFDLDLGRLAESALEKQLNRHVGLLSARWEKSDVSLRMSIARLRFDLDRGDPRLLAPAISQALRGDVRLAQALSNRGEPGVVAEFDLMRSGASSASYAGIDIFGLSFFKESLESEGSIVIQTPGGARSILFESLHESSGAFFSREGFNRVVLSGLVFPPELSWSPRGEVNLIFQVTEGDKNMRRDQVLDHLDGIILGVAGADAMSALEEEGNALQRTVESECAGSANDDGCYVPARDGALAAFEDEIDHLSPELQELVLAAAELRLKQQSVYEVWGDFTWGPNASVVTDFRLDEGALTEIMTSGNTGLRFIRGIEEYLGVAEIDREAPQGEIEAERERIRSLWSGNTNAGQRINALEEWMISYSGLYRSLLARERATIASLGPIGSNAVAIHFPVDEGRRPLYEEAVTGTIVQQRAKLVADMIDRLSEIAEGLGPHPAQTVAYGLLSITAPERLELRTDMSFDLQWWEPAYESVGHPERVNRYARGAEVAPVDGGLFSVDALIDLD